MEYLDFELRVNPGTGRDYPVFVVRSPAGETSGTMHLPFDALELESELRGIDAAALRSRSLRREVVMADPTGDTVARFGRRLFDALLTGSVLTALRRSQDRARLDKKGLRLRLRIEAPDLATLPWEFMFDPDAGDYLCLSSATPLVRYIECANAPEVLTVEPPLRVLGVIASPVDRPALDAGREKRRLEEATQGLQRLGLLTLDWLEDSTPRDLQQTLWKDAYHILHFVGHGGFDVARGEGILAFQNEDGTTAVLSATELCRLLADHRSLRLVVLNACLGARGSGTDIFSSTAAVLVRRQVPAVIAMQSEISDRGALEFSRSLYEAIAHGKPVDEAVTEARKAMSLSPQSVEWGTPVLHMRSPDGALFKVDSVLRPVPSVLPAPAPLSETERRNRRTVLDDVKSETTGRLAQILEDGANLTIAYQSQPHQVTRPWDGDVKVGYLRSSSDRTSGDVLDVFDAESTAGKLLILGAPGAGKTGALLRLAQVLVARAEANAAEPLPVLINLSSWLDDKRTFAEWFVGELKAKYGIRQSYGRSLIAGQRLALLLDGLDELPVARQEAAVLALNEFHRDRRPHRLVVCCRTAEYENYSVKLELRGAIQLLPLADSQIREYLDGVSAHSIWQSLGTDAELMEMARSPLFLRMMALAREEITANDWQCLDSPAKRRSFLFEAYIRYLLAPPVTKGGYPNDRSMAWLARLAAAMKDEGAEEFLLERMQPTWLQSRGQLFAYRLTVAVSSAVAFRLASFADLTDLIPSGVATRALENVEGMAALQAHKVVVGAVIALAVGVAVAAKRIIKPIETLRWSTANAREGLRRWPLKAVRLGFAWAASLGSAGWLIGVSRTSVATANTEPYPRLGMAGSVVGILIGGFALAAMVHLSLSGAIDRFRRGVTPRVVDALLVGFLFWCSTWLLVGGSAAGMLMTFAAASLALVLGWSPWLDEGLADRLTLCVVVGFVGWLGVMRLIPAALWRDWFSTWLVGGIGLGTTIGFLAMLTTRFAGRRGTRVADTQLGLSSNRRLARIWGRRVLLGLLLALGLQVPSFLTSWAGWVRVVRGGLVFESRLTSSLATVLTMGTLGGLLLGVSCAVIGMFIGVLLGVLQGFTGPDVERRTVPNQGIRQSARNIGLCFLIGALSIGVPYGLTNLGIAWLSTGVFPDRADLLRIVGSGAFLIGLLGGLVPGAACFQHFTLRFILWCQGAMPWHYVHFLDQATERMLLQRIGGRYRFIHVMLRDHFAEKA